MGLRTALLFALLTLALAAPAAAETPPSEPIALSVGDSRFWLGGQIDSGNVQNPTFCDVVAPCPTFELHLAGGGTRLRVAYDTPQRTNSFELDVTGPDGQTTTVDGSNVFDAEAFVSKPAAGTWHVRVIPKGVDHAFFRMRAKLEGRAPDKPATKVPVLPDLRADPPYEFGFVAPANPLNAAYPPDTVNPPLSVAGQEPVSCTADEMAPTDLGGGGAHDCLRLTSGPMNVGDGPFLKVFHFATDVADGSLSADGAFIRGAAYQEILWSDGSYTERRAGTYSFHVTHAHFHDDGILTYEIFKVVGDQLVPAGKGTKSGFCPADQLMGEWRTFTQDPAGEYGPGDAPTGSCYGAADNGLLSLTRGWGDVYRWQRPGQYVEWTGNGDGDYVVRTTVDKSNTTLETDESDNASYALIRVTGRNIDLLERGWGSSPFDRQKVVFTGFGPASQDPYGELPAAAVGPAESVSADRTAPRIARVGFRSRTISFKLREAAVVHVSVLSGKRIVRRLTLHATPGANSVSVGRLPAGRYRLVLLATDDAGNTARPVIKRVRIASRRARSTR
jgi:hypothetical protein